MTFFAPHEEVCPDSAKVQLNMGILARRRRDYPLAATRFRRARAIEPGYCEPTYWLALTALNQAGVDMVHVELVFLPMARKAA